MQEQTGHPVKGRKVYSSHAALACWGVFVSSLFWPAWYLEGADPFPAINLLLVGWLGLLLVGSNVLYLAWLANPCFLLATVLLVTRFYKAALAFSLLSSGFALMSFGLRTITVNEAGHDREVIGYGLGFYIWISAIAILVSAAAFFVWRSSSTPVPPARTREMEGPRS